jgi:hypothetical protein
MALLRNGRSIYQNPGRLTAGSVNFEIGGYVKGGLRNRFFGAFNQTFGGWPQGYLAPSSVVLPQKAGAMSSRTIAQLILAGAGTLTPAQPMSGSSTFTLSVVNAQLDQIVSLVANATGAITVDTATLAASIGMTANANGEITVTLAQIGAIISSIASSSMSISGSATTLTAQANMIAEAGGPTPLSPEGLAQAVWDALIADFQNPGSTGEALNNAGSAGNPWDGLLSANNDPGTFGERVQKLLTKNQFLGLK